MATISSSSTSGVAAVLAGAVAVMLAVPSLAAHGGEARCPSVQGGSPLATVTVFDCPPHEHADLLPDSFRKMRGDGRSEWDVAYVFAAGRKVFVQCEYGPGAAAVLIEPAASTPRCAFVTKGATKKSFACTSRVK